MAPTAGPSNLSDVLITVVRTVIAEVRPQLIEAAFSGNHGEGENTRHADNFLSKHDLWMHDRYRNLLADQLRSFIYASEEAEPELIGQDANPDLCILVDPLDTSELAVRGLNGYTHVMAYSRSQARPIAAVVGDIYHHVQLYVAALEPDGHDQAYAITTDGTRRQLVVPAKRRLSESIITNYLMRPGERFLPLSQQTALIRALDTAAPDGKQRGRIGVDFGSIGLCHVASGFTDAIVEFAKGFAIWDLAPGHYILTAAGGTVVDLDGTPLPLDYNLSSDARIAEAMKPRQKFVAAGSAQLAEEIVRVLKI